MNLPTDIANQALDAIGWSVVLGDIEDGTREAQVLLRAYGQCRRQLLRAAHWNYARKTANLILLADGTGNTAGVGTVVPVPWIYEYALPGDCMKARFIPWNRSNISPGVPAGNITPANPNSPTMPGLQSALPGQRIRPARFNISVDYNYPIPPGELTWEQQGASPVGRTVVLTDVQQAQLVYTADIQYPAQWDSLFREAMVGYLAQQIALAIWVKEDKKFGLEVRNAQIAITKAKVMEARLQDGNEGWPTNDIPVDWMNSRRVGGPYTGAGGYGGFAEGYGYCCSYDSLGFADGTAY
jgi:hypothetical protein